MRWHEPAGVSRRRAICLAAATTLGAALAPGTFRLLSTPVNPVPVMSLPAGFHFLQSPNFGLRFAIPDDLVLTRPDSLLTEYGALVTFQEMADRTGATVDEWTHHQVTGVDAFAVAEDGTSVNVMRTPSEHVPTPAELADEVRALQMDAVRWGRTETVFGPATTLRSTLTLFGGALRVPGYVLWARNDRGVFSIQVTSESADVVDALYGIVLRTLQPLPPTAQGCSLMPMAETPSIDGIHHITLSVSDLDRSVRWYSEVLGFAERRRVQVNGMAKAMLIRDDLLITLTEHGEFAEPGPFNERHAGLDHLGVAVADRATLDAWIAHLDGLGVAHGDVTRGATGDLIAFRDPDNIALEFYTRG